MAHPPGDSSYGFWMHTPRLAGVLGTCAHSTHLLAGPGQSTRPPSPSMTLHPYPRSGPQSPPSGTLFKKQAVRHRDPEGPEPVSTVGSTQQTCPVVQSLGLVQATQTGDEQKLRPASVHVLVEGQQTSGGVHGMVVQSTQPAPASSASSPLLSPPPADDEES
jgi:hypothetical protein